jgi:hypothetical protein
LTVAGFSGSAEDLVEPLARVVVGHVVSSSSMVSRAYLTDPLVGVIVESAEGDIWLASVLSALVPDADGLRVRAAETGGIPVEHGTPRLAKLTLSWGGIATPVVDADVVNPVVVPHEDDASIAVVSLRVPASLGERIRGDGPTPLRVDTLLDGDGPPVGAEVAIATLFESGDSFWPLLRFARVCSDPGFSSEIGAVALDLGIRPAQAGSPVFLLGNSEPSFCGLVKPLDEKTSVLVPPLRIAETIGR